jgi:hypothetical protein
MSERFRLDDRLTLLLRISYSSGFTIADFQCALDLNGDECPSKQLERPKFRDFFARSVVWIVTSPVGPT